MYKNKFTIKRTLALHLMHTWQEQNYAKTTKFAFLADFAVSLQMLRLWKHLCLKTGTLHAHTQISGLCSHKINGPCENISLTSSIKD